MTNPRSAEPIRTLYLLTSEVSKVFVRGQLAFLIDQGHRVTLGTRVATQPVDGVDAGVEVVDLPYVRAPAPLQDLRGLVATVRLVRRLRPQVVHAATPKAGLLGMVAARVCRVPVRVYAIHGLRYETTTGLPRRVYRLLERVAAWCANHVIADSASLLAVAVRDGVLPARKGIVVGAGSSNGVDPVRFSRQIPRAEARQTLGIDPESRVIGFVGRLTADKGVDELVSVFVSMIAEAPDTVLLLVGDAEVDDPIPESAAALIRDHEQIVHVPWLDDPEVAFRAMDVLAFPSHREGLPNVPLEAQLCGVPVVAYAATGTVDAVTDGGVLIEVGDARALAHELERLLDDPATAATMGERGTAWVLEHFDQRRLWSSTEALYREWLASSS